VKRGEKILLGCAGMLTAAGVTAFLLKVPIGVRGEWVHQYEEKPDLWRLVFVAPAAAVLYFFVFDAGFKRFLLKTRAVFRIVSVWLILGLLFLFSILFQRFDFYNSVISMCINSYGGAFVIENEKIKDIREYLELYPLYISEIRTDGKAKWEEFGSTRVISNPPGTQVTLALLERTLLRTGENRIFFSRLFMPDDMLVTDADGDIVPDRLLSLAATGAYFIYLMASLSVIPLFLLLERIAGKKQALEMIPFCVVIPSLFIFAPGKDVLQLPLFFFFWYFSYRALADNKLLYAILAGAVFYLGLFFTLGMIVALAIVVGCAGIEYLLRKFRAAGISYASALKYCGGAAAGFGVFAGAFYWLLHYNFIACFKAVYANHARFYDSFSRTYSKWVLMNLLDFAIFLGLPLAVLLIFSAASQVKRLLKKDYPSISPYFWAVLIVFILLDISGKNLGETGRLWLFFMPLASVIAASVWKGRDAISARALYGLLALQLFYAAIVRICFDVKSVSARIAQGFEAIFW